jgi:subtilisin family serine protease
MNIDNINPAAYHPNIVRVKLTKEVRAVKSFTLGEGIKNIRQIFAEEISVKSVELTKQHQSKGLDLWYELEIEGSVADAIHKLEKNPQIDIAEPLYHTEVYGMNPQVFYTPQELANDPHQSHQWALDKIEWRAAYEIWKTLPKQEVEMAVLDYYADHDHPDLEANHAGGKNFHTIATELEAGRHGTHCAGIIAATTNNNIGVIGVAGGDGTPNSGAKIVSCQVFHDGKGRGFENAFIWAADNGCAISSNSWGINMPGLIQQSYHDAIDYFVEFGGGTALRGGLGVFASGNSNSPQPFYPGAYWNVVNTAATGPTDKRAFYSNHGPTIDISAPGGDSNFLTAGLILNADVGGGYVWMQGTSMACPHVAGVAAMICSVVPGLTADQLRHALLTGVDDINEVNPDMIGMLGSGRLNAYKALLVALGQEVPDRKRLIIKQTGNGKVNYPLGVSLIATGTQINLVAEKLPESNHHFEKFIIDGNTITEPSIDFILDKDTVVEVFFRAQLTVTVEQTEGGKSNPAPGVYTYFKGSSFRAIAYVNSGYKWKHWRRFADGEEIAPATGRNTSWPLLAEETYKVIAVFESETPEPPPPPPPPPPEEPEPDTIIEFENSPVKVNGQQMTLNGTLNLKP